MQRHLADYRGCPVKRVAMLRRRHRPHQRFDRKRLRTVRPGSPGSIARRTAPAWLILLVVACSDLIGPSFPDVAGTYTGTVTLSLTGGGSVDGSMSMVVAQSDEQLTITGSITFLGETTQLPAVTGTINETGFFTATAGGFSGTTSDPQCGTWTTTSATLSFSGGTARLQESASSAFCGTLNLFGTLTRA